MISLQEAVGNLTTGNETDALHRQYNLEMLNARIPSMTILGTLIFFGVIGNAVVIYIYRKKLSTHPELWYFIPWLAFFDFIATVLGASLALIQDLFSMSFPSLYLCKILWFSVVISTTSGASCLLIIAVQRYIYVFNKPSMTLKWRRISILVTILFSILIALPVFYVVELRNISFRGLKGEVCGDTKNDRKLVLKYSYFHSLLFISCINIVVITFLYVKIGTKTYQLLKPRNESQHSWEYRRRVGLNFTLMYIVVFMVYSASYLPTIVIILLGEQTKTEIFHNIDNKVKLNGVLVAHRMFLFSHVLNPLIFFLFHAKFRMAVKGMFTVRCNT